MSHELTNDQSLRQSYLFVSQEQLKKTLRDSISLYKKENIVNDASLIDVLNSVLSEFGLTVHAQRNLVGQ